jgi:hypothetical protein
LIFKTFHLKRFKMKTLLSFRGGASMLALLTVIVLSGCQKKAEETTGGNPQNPAGETAATPAVVATPANETSYGSSASGKLGVAPKGTTCPTDSPIKGVTSKKQGKIYHTTKYPDYKTVKAEKCFADVAAAEKAGYKAPK